jgi:2-C-methyl-D-erythritol 4-phosphate cytidylyltransferase / 2-C-methyl-D-erythritol 2,4-cyclodiphosphate synthase
VKTVASRPTAIAIVLGAGAGRRLGADEPKAFLTVAGRPILAMAAAAAAASPAVSSVMITVPAGFEDRARACVMDVTVPVSIVAGGETRQASVRRALAALADEVRIVAIHDAARPFAPPELFTTVVDAVARGVDGAVPVLPIVDTVKRLDGDRIVGTEDRSVLGLAQTPQGFRLDAIRAGHERAATEGQLETDDAALVERDGAVEAVPGDPSNFKITTLLDLARAEERMGGIGA